MSQAMVTVNRICFLFCLLIIGLVIIQAVLFIRNALMFNKKHRVLSEDEVRSVMKIGCVSAIAPACSIIVVALGLGQPDRACAVIYESGSDWFSCL